MLRLLTVLILVSSIETACGQDNREQIGVKAARCSLENVNGRLRATCDLGTLPLNSIVPVLIQVYNPLNNEVQLGTYFSGCTCIEATVSREFIPSQDAATVGIKLTTPKIARSVDQNINFVLATGKSLKDKSFGTTIFIKYQIEGLAAFREPRIVAVASPEDKALTFRTPLVVGEPVQSQNLSINGTGALSHINAKIVRRESEYFCECTLPLDGIEEYGLSGELVLVSKEGVVLDSVLCTAMLQPPVSVSPSPLLVSWSESDKRFTANGIVRILTNNRPGEPEAKPRTTSENAIVIAGTIGDKPVAIVSKQLTPEIARFNLSFSPQVEWREFAAEPNSSSMSITVTVRGTTRTAKVPLRYEATRF